MFSHPQRPEVHTSGVWEVPADNLWVTLESYGLVENLDFIGPVSSSAYEVNQEK